MVVWSYFVLYSIALGPNYIIYGSLPTLRAYTRPINITCYRYNVVILLNGWSRGSLAKYTV